ncbi:MAG TPA: hypothetical protein DCG53_02555 [Syntrophus sp. (in: bacteria)]|nr:hypothetical protein [Syntrophus sp. (in: bacteria)]
MLEEGADLLQKGEIGSQMLRAFQWYLLAFQIYLVYLKELTASQKISTCSGHCVYKVILILIPNNQL